MPRAALKERQASGLTKQHQEVLGLKDEGCNIEDISIILRIPESKARELLQEARRIEKQGATAVAPAARQQATQEATTNRRKAVDDQKVKELTEKDGLTVTQIAAQLDVSKNAIYVSLRRQNTRPNAPRRNGAGAETAQEARPTVVSQKRTPLYCANEGALDRLVRSLPRREIGESPPRLDRLKGGVGGSLYTDHQPTADSPRFMTEEARMTNFIGEQLQRLIAAASEGNGREVLGAFLSILYEEEKPGGLIERYMAKKEYSTAEVWQADAALIRKMVEPVMQALKANPGLDVNVMVRNRIVIRTYLTSRLVGEHEESA